MRILFMGTPDICIPTLDYMNSADFLTHHSLIGIVTQEDKPRGRGYALTPPPAKMWGIAHNIPVFQPTTLKNNAFADTLHELSPDLIVVLAYGKILPPYVLNYPSFGSVCLHGSLLPRWRGAAPIQRAIMAGDTITGITSMMMDEGVDTGDILYKVEVPVLPTDTFEQMHDKLSIVAPKALDLTLSALENGTLQRKKQPSVGATYAAKIEKAECLLDFSFCATDICNKVRGLSPFPMAFTHTPDGKMLKIVSCSVETEMGMFGAPGQILSNETIRVACGQGVVSFDIVLPEGKGKMTAKEYLRGHKIPIGTILQ